jgi:hypothetical protein
VTVLRSYISVSYTEFVTVDLGSDINAVKTAMINGISPTESDINTFMEKIAKRTRLNDELVKIRDGES